MSYLQEVALRAAVLGALGDLIGTEHQTARADTLTELLAARAETGLAKVDVCLPGGEAVASVTLPKPSTRAAVTDRAAFTAWAEQAMPDKVTEATDPVQAAMDAAAAAEKINRDTLWISDEDRHRNTARHVLAALGIPETPGPARVDKTTEKDVIDHAIPGADGTAVDPETGEVIPGVTITPPGLPTRFQMRYQPDGRDRIAAAWRDGTLGPITGLPQLTDTDNTP